MIDDRAQVIDLMNKIEAQLPIPANPTSATVRQLREQGLKIGAGRTCKCFAPTTSMIPWAIDTAMMP